MISRLTSQDALGTAAATSVGVNYPGATTAGDLLLATVYTGAAGVPAISGWTGTTQGINSNTAQMGIFTKIADGTETTVTATAAATSLMNLHIYEYTANSNPITFDVAFVGNGTTVGSTTWALTTVSTNYPGALVFASVGLNGDSTSPSYSVLNIRQSDARMMDGDLISVGSKSNLAPSATWTSTLKPSGIIGVIRPFFHSGLPGNQGNFLTVGSLSRSEVAN